MTVRLSCVALFSFQSSFVGPYRVFKLQTEYVPLATPYKTAGQQLI